MSPYKELKDDAKEIAKDLQTTKKWLGKTAKKLKQFSRRDIFEEYDEVAKQIRALDKEVKFIGHRLADTLETVIDNMAHTTELYRHSVYLRGRIERLEKSQTRRLLSR